MLTVSAKNVIIARRIGDIPLPSEKLPSERYANITTHTDERNPTTIATRSIIPTQTRSILGGPRSSSVERVISESILLFSDIVGKK